MISIIGAGPVGCYCAYLLAKAGFEVNIFEDHDKVGLPVQCTGLVTDQLWELIPEKKEFVVNKLSKVKVFSRNKSAEIQVNETLVDRHKFDNYLLDKAVKEGTHLHLNHKFIEYSNNEAVFKSKGKINKIKTKILIGADGPLSQVAKIAGLFNKRKFFIGMQATVQGKFEKNKYETFFGRVAPGFFAWIVPESETRARVGLATRHSTRAFFEKFASQKGTIIDMQGGAIPIYNPLQKIQNKSIFLVGDAAGFCKSTTGGGLVPGLNSAKILADCIINNKSYPANVRKLRRELLLHNVIRSALDRFNESDYDKLVSMMNNPKIKQQLSSSNRDTPVKLMPKLLLANPKLLYFSKCLLQKKKSF